MRRESCERAAARRAAIDRHLWDPERGVYLDYHWAKTARNRPITAATLYPLFIGLASEAAGWRRSRQRSWRDLLRPGGIVTTTVDTGQQWDAPNGWAPLQWIAVEGLNRYGETGSPRPSPGAG